MVIAIIHRMTRGGRGEVPFAACRGVGSGNLARMPARRSFGITWTIGVLVAAAVLACARTAPSGVAADKVGALGALVDPDLQLLVTPSPDHAPFVRAIDAATSSIDLAMYHLTDPQVVDALVRATGRGVRVRVILDGTSLSERRRARPFAMLQEGGVDARRSSIGGSASPTRRAMVIDRLHRSSSPR